MACGEEEQGGKGERKSEPSPQGQKMLGLTHCPGGGSGDHTKLTRVFSERSRGLNVCPEARAGSGDPTPLLLPKGKCLLKNWIQVNLQAYAPVCPHFQGHNLKVEGSLEGQRVWPPWGTEISLPRSGPQQSRLCLNITLRGVTTLQRCLFVSCE